MKSARTVGIARLMSLPSKKGYGSWEPRLLARLLPQAVKFDACSKWTRARSSTAIAYAAIAGKAGTR